MRFPKYYVTYGVMDMDAGANPFGHAFLLLSEQKDEKAPVSVTDSFGFYGQPSTTTNPYIKTLKSLLGLSIDLQDGHGVLKYEKLHELDGNGLHGRSFEVTQEQFFDLRRQCTLEIEAEDSVKKHWDKQLGHESNGYTRFKAEEDLARKEGKLPRLLPFHIEMNVNINNGFDSTKSHTCKTRALTLLQNTNIITQDIRDELNGGAAQRAFPRFSGEKVLPIRLVSTGCPDRIESKRTGQVFYNRNWGMNQLFFASPMNLDKVTAESQALNLDSSAFQSIKHILTHIRQVENTLRLTIENPEHSMLKCSLKVQLERIQATYELFKNVHENCTPDRLQAKLAHAEKYLNVATLSLTPDRVDSSFAFRVYESVFAQNALLGLTGLIITAALIGGAIGMTLILGATLYTTYNLYEFYQEQTKFQEMKQDYLEFQAQGPAFTPSSNEEPENDLESISRAATPAF